MAENRSRFIKTVPFGGYDRTDVDKRLEFLYAQVYVLKNELRESKLTLEKLRKGTEAEKTHESVLAVERAKLTELQVKNETMTDRLKRAEEENKLKEKELAALQEQYGKLNAALENANSELTAMRAGGDAAALGAVFVEAQKSRDMILNEAKNKAAGLKTESETLAANIITDADNKAAMIIYEAEKRAAEVIAEALTKVEQMKVASQNMKASMLQEVESIGAKVATLRQAMETFVDTGFKMVTDSNQLMADTAEELKKGGVPVFTEARKIQPQFPDQPELKQVSFPNGERDSEEAKKRSDELDKLQAMAEAIGGGKKSSGNTLNDLARQAAALNGGKPAAAAPQSNTGGGISLADLAKQAQNASGGQPQVAAQQAQANTVAKSKAGSPAAPPQAGINLAELARQAEEAANKNKK